MLGETRFFSPVESYSRALIWLGVLSALVAATVMSSVGTSVA